MHCEEVKKKELEAVIYNDTKMFDRDPYEKIDGTKFIFVKAEYAQGIHLVGDHMAPKDVYVDHLPANTDLINQYAAIGSRRLTNIQHDTTFFVWQNKRKEETIRSLMRDNDQTELLDGIRIINILRGKDQFVLEDTHEFDRQFSKTWRISLRSLYKQFNINDLKRWEKAGMNFNN